jgi:hypothetical protein
MAQTRPRRDDADALAAAAERWDDDGFVVLPGYLADAIGPAVDELPALFPTADEFHDDVDPARNARFRSEFGGIDPFPLAGVELSLLCVHPRLLDLAAALLRTDDLRAVSAEAWAKYTGAADYDQRVHRDFLNHTPLVPTDDLRFRQVEMFVYLGDVDEDHGPPHYVSRRVADGRPVLPNWLSRDDAPELYAAEVSAAGPAGTVVAYEIGTFHRGTQLTAPRGARYTLNVNVRPAGADWGVRHGWADRAYSLDWYAFVGRASPRQLGLFGFPPPGHPYWTAQTLTRMADRYPDLDLAPWSPG